MFCVNCGAEITSEVQFCPKCGNPVGQAQGSKGVATTAEERGGWLASPRRLIRLAAGVAVFSFAILPQASCMGQSFNGLQLLNAASDYDKRGLLFLVLVLVSAALALVLGRPLVGAVGVVAQAIVMSGYSRYKLNLELGSFVTLAAFLVVLLGNRLSAALGGPRPK